MRILIISALASFTSGIFGLVVAEAEPVCIDAILSSIPYSAALTPHSGSCPTGTPGAYDLAANVAGCCASDLRIVTLGKKGAACCPCGAACTGYFPPLAQWTEIAGVLEIDAAVVIATLTASSPTTAVVTSTIPSSTPSATGSNPSSTLAPDSGVGSKSSLFGAGSLITSALWMLSSLLFG